jgi:hypothetical protein
MPPTRLVRTGVAAAATALSMVAIGARAQGLPATPPTSSTPGSSLSAPLVGTTSADDHNSRPHRAQVIYAGDQVNIRANDSSLNQILRSISRSTGLKITGGVQDERVFGDYGPASLSAVLATLLDGTGTNILFLAGDATNPPELVLTPRAGGPTPPSPQSATYAEYDAADTAPSPQSAPAAQSVPAAMPQPARSSTPPPTAPATIAQPLNNVNGSPTNTSPTASTLPTTQSVPLDAVPAPSTTPSTSGIVDAPNPPAPGSTTGTAPNGALTPEQVMQQLMELQKQNAQQQQQQNGQTPNNSTPPQ